MWTLGFDPGRTGACVLLNQHGVPVVAWAWKPCTRKKVGHFKVAIVQLPNHSRTETVATLHNVGMMIHDGALRVMGSDQGLSLWYEAAVMGRASFSSIAKLAINTGAVMCPMMQYTVDHKAKDVRASHWRKKIIGMKNFTRTAKAKAGSIQHMMEHTRYAKPILGLVMNELGTQLEKLDHVTDALGVALYGIQQENRHEGGGA